MRSRSKARLRSRANETKRGASRSIGKAKETRSGAKRSSAKGERAEAAENTGASGSFTAGKQGAAEVPDSGGKPRRPAAGPRGAEQKEEEKWQLKTSERQIETPQGNKEPQKPVEESPSQEQKRQAMPRMAKAREKRQEDITPRPPGGREAGREEEENAG